MPTKRSALARLDPTKRRGVYERKDGRKLKRECVYLPADLALNLAVYCARIDRDKSDVVSEAVAKLLGGANVS